MTSTKIYSVGIGVTSYKRPECLKECLEYINKYTQCEYKIHVAIDTDEDRRGVSYRKNECLRELKGCDYIFLFDDDCFPVTYGWEKHFIESKYNHLLYLNNTHNYLKSINGDAKIYNNCGGVFIYLTKEALLDVGAFNEDFDTFGFEHAEYSQRIHKAGLIVSPYICLNETSKYIYSKDYSNPLHKSSISTIERNELVKRNWNKYFNEPIKNIYIPL